MMPGCTLRLTGDFHSQLKSHLFPGDGAEAAAVLVCTRSPGKRLQLLAKKLILVLHE